MLEMILDKHMIFVGIGVMAALGAGSKCVVNVTLKRLVRAAGNRKCGSICGQIPV